MGAVADTLFTALMSWVRALVSDLWTIASPERTSMLEFLGKHWIALTLLLLAVGLALDWLIWLVRWQPYRLWAQRIRRALRMGPPPEEDDEPQAARAHAARMPERRESQRPAAQDWLPLAPSEPDEEEARLAMERAGQVPDASLRAYPGMRYDADRVGVYEEPPEGSDLSSVRSEGPGAAETARRQAEIAAWNRQLEDEAREWAEQARLAQEAEQARLVRLAQEQERARREAQQEQAQRRYEAEMAEYERQMAQYRRDLEEYERQKAAYDAAQAPQASQATLAEPVAPAAQEQERAHRAPQAVPEIEPEPEPEEAPARRDGLMSRVARAVRRIEPEETDVSAIPSLPPRVDKFDAYAPPVRPPRGRRSRKS